MSAEENKPKLKRWFEIGLEMAMKNNINFVWQWEGIVKYQIKNSIKYILYQIIFHVIIRIMEKEDKSKKKILRTRSLQRRYAIITNVNNRR